MAKTVAEVLSNWAPEAKECAVPLSGISMNSKTLRPGELFVAWGGGYAFIDEAVERGAAAVLVEKGHQRSLEHLPVPIAAVESMIQTLGLIAARFYDEPSRTMRLTAVTGTNGKTSVSQYVARILSALGEKSAVVGLWARV